MTVAAIAERRPAGGFLGLISTSQYTLIAEGGPSIAGEPAVSIIVPCRERRALLAETMEALFEQNLSPRSYEVIIVDNASKDGTTDLLREAAARSPVPFRACRLKRDQGPAVARNLGVLLARGSVVAFTDSDCVPSKGWLSACLKEMEAGAAIVQGRTLAVPGQRQPLFNHFIETTRLDGSFSTSNVAYRRRAVLEAGGFDPSRRYWEDVDLGWRVRRLGLSAVFAPEALVYHQVMPLSPWAWLAQPRRFHNWPAKAARYPEFRRHLFLGLWVHWFHALFDAFLMGLLLARWRRRFLLLTLPYLTAFALRRRLTGRMPALKALAHFAHDVVSFCALVTGSIRFRSPVL